MKHAAFRLLCTYYWCTWSARSLTAFRRACANAHCRLYGNFHPRQHPIAFAKELPLTARHFPVKAGASDVTDALMCQAQLRQQGLR